MAWRRYTYRQLGVLETGDGAIGLSLLAHPGDGTHETAVKMAEDLAAGVGELIGADRVSVAKTCRVV